MSGLGMRRATPRPRWAPVVWLVAAADLVAVAVASTTAPGSTIYVLAFTAALTAVLAAFAVVGALVSTRQPSNMIGWILLAAATLIAGNIAGTLYATGALASAAVNLPVTTFVAWASGTFIGGFTILTLVFIPLLFPDGHLPSHRWRPVAWFGVFAIIFGTTLTGLAPGPLSSIFPSLSNPFGVDALGPLVAAYGTEPGVGIFVLLPFALAAPIVRFRRGTTVERAQIRWLAAAAAGAIVLLVVFVTVLREFELGWLVALAGIALLPVAIGIAILRYRLYEIDRLISRTLSYAAVTVTLALVFVVGVIGLQALLEPLTGNNTVAVAGSTLVVAALFQPLRRRMQRVVDRRFDRARYDAERTVAAFATRLRDDVDLVSVRGDLLGVVAGSLQPASIAVWMRDAPGWVR